MYRPSLVRPSHTFVLWALVLASAQAPSRASAQACGAESQRPCNFWERVPSCNELLVESGRTCVHPQCGRVTERFSDISMGAFHRCGLHLDGTLACAGEVPGTQPTDTFVEVSAGLTHTCARRKDGPVSCWGNVGTQTIPSPSGTFVRLESGNGTCGQRPDRTLSCWGSPVAPPGGAFADFDVGANNACGLRDDGSVECWGGSEYLNPPPGQYQQVSLGVQHGCGLLLSGEVLCWGDDQFGQATLPATL